MSEQKQFVNGLIAKAPNDNAPDFIKARLSIKVDELIEFLQSNKKPDGWVNCDIKVSKGGKWYVELDTWEPSAAAKPGTKNVASGAPPSDIPF